MHPRRNDIRRRWPRRLPIAFMGLAAAVGLGTPASASTAPHRADFKLGLYRGTTSPVLQPEGLKVVRARSSFEFILERKASKLCGGPTHAKAMVDCFTSVGPLGQYGTFSLVRERHACSGGTHIGVIGTGWTPLVALPANGVLKVRQTLHSASKVPLATITANFELRPNGTFSGTLKDVVEETHGHGLYTPTCSTGQVILRAHWVSAKTTLGA